MSSPLYVFDLDETLIQGDCAMIWNAFLVDKGIATSADFIAEDRRLMALYAQGKMDMEDYLRFSIAPLANLTTSEVEQLVKECVETRIVDKLFPQANTLINHLANEGIDMLIISASVSFLVAEVGRCIGIRQTLGINMREVHGRYSAEIEGVPSYRQGKITRLQQWQETQPKHYSEIHFYTDSINDLPLCEYADFAYLVNPCPQLKQHAHRPNWTVLHWG
ncbi:HAD-IB family hydrolase [Vibrio vulnificus]|uniref:HAD family hydrolase n=1 Tax=Vibrio vulnificus TaxID=672 RepID=UPI0009B6D768|nr:HAD family hydrolase [Vibrio vulnificus]EHU5126220.1 HAD-IB family hydrolase [Vibrio vulnificus]EIT7020768.1 HAD-IB family hydrolase [Vibrio vulnificus]EIV8618945.1 HAD-IB family hydrolase [Vibrio vulnificus]EKA7343720.1 HAD-IB family hydrolase [Vibrio vulnificus]ELQ2523072.1 HAD-IB family hydrolase [Vibrio vulnificus]